MTLFEQGYLYLLSIKFVILQIPYLSSHTLKYSFKYVNFNIQLALLSLVFGFQSTNYFLQKFHTNHFVIKVVKDYFRLIITNVGG